MQTKLRLSSQGIVVMYANNDLETIDKLNKYYPVHYNRKGTEATLSARFIPEVLKDFRGIDESNIVSAPQQIQSLYWRETAARRRVDDLMQNGPTHSPVVNEHLTLMRHQELGREIAQVRDRFAFYMDVRTGKTPLSLSIIHDDVTQHPEHKWLVVCPLILIKSAWIEDATTFVPDLDVVNCHASTKDGRLKALQRRGNIYITNIESFANYKEYFDEVGFYGCIIDESSCMKSPKARQTKALVDFAQTVKRLYLLAGRPSPNGLWELYAQLKALDYYSVPSSYTKFKEKYFVNVSFNSNFEKLENNPLTIHELIDLTAKYAIYVDQGDAFNTAGRTFNVVELDMPDELKKQYNKLRRELYLEVGDKPLTTNGAGAVYNKLRQVSSGFIIDTQAVKENKFYDEAAQEVYLLNDYKFQALYDLLGRLEAGAQVIIWAQYRAEFEHINRHLAGACAVVNGSVSLQEKERAISDFKAGRVQYLIMHPQSAKFGLTLTNAHIAVYFSMSFSFEDWYQSTARIYGSVTKQPKHCDYYTLVTKGTIDEQIYDSVTNGKQISNLEVLRHLRGTL